MTKRKAGSTTPPKSPWTADDIETLIRNYPERPTAELAKEMHCSISRVYSKASELGLHKSDAFMESERSGRILRGRVDPRMTATQFKPGHTSWNTGVAGICGTHPNSRRTQFKSGRPAESSHNYLPIGSERLSKDGYLERKVTDNPDVFPARRWIGVHRLVWEASNGPVPPGHVICFLPGRRTNDRDLITLDALELVSRAELARRNHPRARDPELAALVQLKGAITRQVNRIYREAKEKQS